MKQIDAHLHVWSGDPAGYPYLPGTPDGIARGDAEFLLELQADAGVDGALIVQPIHHGFDHSYVNDVLEKYPDKFVGMALADPAADDPTAALQVLKDQHGYQGVRINPGLWPAGQSMDGPIGDQLMSFCAETGLVAGFLIEPSHFGQVNALCSRYPETRTIIDHFGSVKPGQTQELKELLALARHPKMHVKVSRFPVSSESEWPYTDMSDTIHGLIDAFGVERLMFATDFPHVVAQCGYARGWQIADHVTPSLTDEQRVWLMGGTVMKLFNAWGN
ncbi:MAG: amidohydrolase [Chloroflexi bacterium]|nr:amidohydrolase [Chloroflexota bacterium]